MSSRPSVNLDHTTERECLYCVSSLRLGRPPSSQPFPKDLDSEVFVRPAPVQLVSTPSLLTVPLLRRTCFRASTLYCDGQTP